MATPRHVPAPTTIGYTDTDGSQVEIASQSLGDYHYLQADTPQAEAILEALDLPVARKVLDHVPAPAVATRAPRQRPSRAKPAVAVPEMPPVPESTPTPVEPTVPESNGGPT